MKKSQIIKNGLIYENPVFRLVLGTCPTLATTTGALTGLSMGLAATFVLICSNVLISLLRKVIPDRVRIPAYIVIIATFVTLVEMIMKKYMYDLYESLGLFLPLIVVNCIILARAEAFASKNPVLDSTIDGVAMGLGFTLSLTIMGAIREILGVGEFFGLSIPFIANPMTVFILPAGGFLTFGILIASMNAVMKYIDKSKKQRADNAQLKESIQALCDAENTQAGQKDTLPPAEDKISDIKEEK